MKQFSVLIASVFSLALAAGLTGLPKEIAGFEKWTKVAQNLTTDGPHAGQNKIVFANLAAAKAWKGQSALPVGSWVVKTADNITSPSFVAIMKKTTKGWDYAEYTSTAGKYKLIGSGAFCSSCHENAKAKDYLFSR